MFSRDYFLIFIGGFAGSSATFFHYSNFLAALIFLLIGLGLECYIFKKGVSHV